MKKLMIAAIALVGMAQLATAKPKEIGLQLYSVREDIKGGLEETLDAVAKMGYTSVETAGYDNGKFYGMEPEAFKQLLKEKKLKFKSAHSNYSVDDFDSWDKTMQWWDQAIAAHKAAGCKNIVIPSMSRFAQSSLKALKYQCDVMNSVAAKCKKAGMGFGYHNHANEFAKLEGEVVYDFMLRNTDPKLVFFQLDFYWIARGGASALDYFNNYPGRFVSWHIKDDKEVGASGKIDFEALFKEYKKAGMKYIIVEQEAYSYPRLESVKRSLEYLQQADFVKAKY